MIEVMLGIDTDDTESGDAGVAACREFGIRHQLLRFKPLGYGALHKYNNALARRANGHWLMIWNDDTLMQSMCWDTALAAARSDFMLLDPTVSNANQKRFRHGLFPIVPRSWVQTTGWLSRSPQCDTYLCLIAQALDIRYGCGLTLFHDRFDETGNNHDATYQARQYATADFYQDRAVLAALNWDATRLARAFGLKAAYVMRRNCRPAVADATEAKAKAEAAAYQPELTVRPLAAAV